MSESYAPQARMALGEVLKRPIKPEEDADTTSQPRMVRFRRPNAIVIHDITPPCTPTLPDDESDPELTEKHWGGIGPDTAGF